jgi:hypothetical protein
MLHSCDPQEQTCPKQRFGLNHSVLLWCAHPVKSGTPPLFPECMHRAAQLARSAWTPCLPQVCLCLNAVHFSVQATPHVPMPAARLRSACCEAASSVLPQLDRTLSATVLGAGLLTQLMTNMEYVTERRQNSDTAACSATRGAFRLVSHIPRHLAALLLQYASALHWQIGMRGASSLLLKHCKVCSSLLQFLQVSGGPLEYSHMGTCMYIVGAAASQ